MRVGGSWLPEQVVFLWRSVVGVLYCAIAAFKIQQLSGKKNMTLAGLEPAIFGSEDQRLIH